VVELPTAEQEAEADYYIEHAISNIHFLLLNLF
jgi:hypothetical protein